jgi:hypothetical protein
MISKRTFKKDGANISAIWTENGKDIKVSVTLTGKPLEWKNFKSASNVKNTEKVGNALYNEDQHQKVKNWMSNL